MRQPTIDDEPDYLEEVFAEEEDSYLPLDFNYTRSKEREKSFEEDFDGILEEEQARTSGGADQQQESYPYEPYDEVDAED